MKKIVKTLILAGSIFVLISCASNSVNQEKSQETEVKEISNHPLGSENEVYQELMDKAVISIGND